MFQKKFLQSISGFERIICGVLTKLFGHIFYKCIYVSRRTTWGHFICGKNSFFYFFLTLPKTKLGLWHLFFCNCCQNCIQQDHRSFLRRSFSEKINFFINFGQWAEQFRPFGETLSTSSHNCAVRVPRNVYCKVVFLSLWAYNHF